MTTAILNKKTNQAKMVALFLAGKPDAEIAEAMGVTRQAISQYRQRHPDVFAKQQEAVAAAIVDVARKDKEERIRHYDAMIDRIEKLIVDRGTGLEAIDYKMLGSGKNAAVQEIRRFDAALVKEWRGLYRDIAEELGEIPTAAPNVTFNDNRTYVREVHTIQQVRLG